MNRNSFIGLSLLGLVSAWMGACTPSRSTEESKPPSPIVTPLPSGSGSTISYGKPTAADLHARLTPLQFEVTQHAATEPPFQNAYWDNHRDGIYVDVVTGEPLFSSRDKFESGTGWPSFTKPIVDGNVISHTDDSLGMERTEVVSKSGGSHLGHVFDDGPAPTGMRYCINSASLRFIPKDRIVAEGYGQFASSFGVQNTSPTPPAATSNSCAVPPPGKTAGCATTLELAIFSQLPDDDRVTKPDGILEVARGFEGSQPAVEITFDPAKLSYAALLETWTKGREKQSQVYAQDDVQKRVAGARAVRIVPAVPFRRETEPRTAN